MRSNRVRMVVAFALTFALTLALVGADAQAAPPPTPTTDTVPPVAAAPAAGNDVDLSQYGIDPGGSAQEESLRIYGFADMMYVLPLFSKTSVDASLLPKENSFSMGSFNLYVTKTLAPHWRSFGEVRLLYAPNGNIQDGKTQNTVATDYANWERPVTWGGISIERLYVEVDVTDWLTLRLGQFLTSYGIWNVDHGSPAIIGVNRPYIIGEGLIPEEQTGIELYGKKFFGDYTLGYHLTISNGRGKLQAIRDLDDDKGLGGRLELETHWLGSTKLGVSAYSGEYTDRTEDVFTPNATGGVVTSTTLNQYNERAIGFDAQWDLGGWHAQGELIMAQRRYVNGGRPVEAGVGMTPDTNYWGWYVLAGKRFDWLGVMPFAQLEYYSFPDGIQSTYLRGLIVPSLGVNVRPIPSIVFKVQLQYGIWVDPEQLLSDAPPFLLGQAQCAWAF